jgi:hypothetical protein
VPIFHVVLRQAGPEFDPGLPLEQQSGWAGHAAFMDSLVQRGHIVLGGPLPNGRVAHAMEAESGRSCGRSGRAIPGTSRT